MLEDMRKYVRAGIQAFSNEGSEQLTSTVMARVQDVADQFSALAAGFRQWSAEAKESLMLEIRELVARQVNEMGLATQQQVQSLRARVDAVERQLRAQKSQKPTPAAKVARSKKRSSEARASGSGAKGRRPPGRAGRSGTASRRRSAGSS